MPVIISQRALPTTAFTATFLRYNNNLYCGNGDAVQLTLSHTVPASFGFSGYKASAGTLTGNGNHYTLTMPDEDVVITAKYSAPPVSYIAENGATQTLNDYYLLTTSTTSLGREGKETWYVAQGTLNYTNGLELIGNTHIIICDGAAINIGTAQNAVSGNGISVDSNTISIYAQSMGDNGILNMQGNPFISDNI